MHDDTNNRGHPGDGDDHDGTDDARDHAGGTAARHRADGPGAPAVDRVVTPDGTWLARGFSPLSALSCGSINDVDPDELARYAEKDITIWHLASRQLPPAPPDRGLLTAFLESFQAPLHRHGRDTRWGYSLHDEAGGFLGLLVLLLWPHAEARVWLHRGSRRMGYGTVAFQLAAVLAGTHGAVELEASMAPSAAISLGRFLTRLGYADVGRHERVRLECAAARRSLALPEPPEKELVAVFRRRLPSLLTS